MSFSRRAIACLVVIGCLVWPVHGNARSHRHHHSTTHGGGTHLYVLLGLGNNSPGLAEFGAGAQRRGIPTTVANHGDEPELAQDAIAKYKSGQLSRIMIVGHSLGGGAAVAMAEELGQAGVPVSLVVTLDPVGETSAPANVRRFVNWRPRDGEDHSSMIAARTPDLYRYVSGR
jgi:pimeloyl-ACP methyl ester carboxylesterase